MFRWTLSRELGLLLLLQVGVLVFVYSQLLPYFLWNGVQQAAQVFMETDAAAAGAYLEREGTLPPNTGRGVQLYNGADELPERYRERFVRDGVLPAGRLRFRETRESGVMLFVHELADGRSVVAVAEASRELLGRPGGVMDKMFELIELRERIGLGFLLFWAVLTAFVVRRIYVRTKRMSEWTNSLTELSETRADPRFGYREFDEVGKELNSAFERIASALEREGEFLRNASHELRTPIAIIQSSLALEQKRNGGKSEALGRIERAAQRMQRLVETLLWLSREETQAQTQQPVDLKAVTEQLIDEHRYLLDEQSVVLISNLSKRAIELPEEPARIVLANLIRNAFQHSHESDHIEVVLSDEGVKIKNRMQNSDDRSNGPSTSDGLGLTLVRKVTERMGWVFQASESGGMHSARLLFGSGSGPDPVLGLEPALSS
ncbi:MAG: HAMP domain-containing sensor histidine kinase [Pseudomonadota bacterium]